MDILGKLDSRHPCINISGMRRPADSHAPERAPNCSRKITRPEINLVCMLFLSPTCASVWEKPGGSKQSRCSLWPANAYGASSPQKPDLLKPGTQSPNQEAGTFTAVDLLPRGITDSPGVLYRVWSYQASSCKWNLICRSVSWVVELLLMEGLRWASDKATQFNFLSLADIFLMGFILNILVLWFQAEDPGHFLRSFPNRQTTHLASPLPQSYWTVVFMEYDSGQHFIGQEGEPQEGCKVTSCAECFSSGGTQQPANHQPGLLTNVSF